MLPVSLGSLLPKSSPQKKRSEMSLDPAGHSNAPFSKNTSFNPKYIWHIYLSVCSHLHNGDTLHNT